MSLLVAMPTFECSTKPQPWAYTEVTRFFGLWGPAVSPPDPPAM